MKADVYFRSLCSEIYNDVFPYDYSSEHEMTRQQVDEHLYQLQLLALKLQTLAVDVRARGASASDFRSALYEVTR